MSEQRGPIDPAARRPHATESGRELDERVAIEVMGWKWFTFDVVGVATPCKARYIAEGEHRDGDREWDGVDNVVVCVDARRDLPVYSKRMQTAWLVVEKMCPTANVSEPWFKLYTSSGKWHADFHYCDGGAWGETAPVAICNAALAAVRSGSVSPSENRNGGESHQDKTKNDQLKNHRRQDATT